jgi:hypothetical protein
MRRIAGAVAALTLILAGSSPAFAQKQISLLALITNPNGPEVPSVQPADVAVNENGKPQKVVKVEPMQRMPKVQILIDNGVGMPAESLGDLRNGLAGLIAAIPPGVEVTLVTTAGQPKFLEKATTDHDKIVAAVGRLSPDTGAGHFVDSLSEAIDRIDKDKQPDAAYTIVAVGTTSGDGDARQQDINKIVNRVQAKQTTVHAVILNKVGASMSGGAIQQDLGMSVAKGSGGRFESVALGNRIATLLPEIGAQMANSLKPGAKQFRITVDRDSAGPLGPLTLSVSGLAASNVRIDR